VPARARVHVRVDAPVLERPRQPGLPQLEWLPAQLRAARLPFSRATSVRSPRPACALPLPRDVEPRLPPPRGDGVPPPRALRLPRARDRRQAVAPRQPLLLELAAAAPPAPAARPAAVAFPLLVADVPAERALAPRVPAGHAAGRVPAERGPAPPGRCG